MRERNVNSNSRRLEPRYEVKMTGERKEKKGGTLRQEPRVEAAERMSEYGKGDCRAPRPRGAAARAEYNEIHFPSSVRLIRGGGRNRSGEKESTEFLPTQ